MGLAGGECRGAAGGRENQKLQCAHEPHSLKSGAWPALARSLYAPDGKFVVDNLNDWQARLGAGMHAWVMDCRLRCAPRLLGVMPASRYPPPTKQRLQHSTMYASFMASGAVDLLAHWLGAPAGIELVRERRGRGNQAAHQPVCGAAGCSRAPCSCLRSPALPSPPYLPALPRLPPQAFLALAFLAEGLLLVFHLKGPQVEILVHLILVLQVFATGAP